MTHRTQRKTRGERELARLAIRNNRMISLMRMEIWLLGHATVEEDEDSVEGMFQ